MNLQRRSVTRITLTVFGVLCWFAAAPAAVWNVNPQGTGDAATIQDAYDLASAGDLIVLAPGTYTDSNSRPIFGYMFQSSTASAVAHVRPGVDITSSGGAETTFIDGQGVRRGLVGADLGSVAVSGISFVQCRTAGSGGGADKWGGGFLAYRSSVLLENNRFVDCVSQAPPGGGGGGILLQAGSGCTVRFNLFLRGTSNDLGGGLELFETAGATVNNNTFVGNVATGQGGGAMTINNSSANVYNNIFAANSGTASLCLNSTVVTSSCNLFWANTPGDVATCSIVVGQDDNINADPLFCHADLDDFTIMANSPGRPNHPSGCGLRGALPVACGTISVTPSTWGHMKSLYRP